MLIVLWTILLHGETIEVVGNAKQRAFLPAVWDGIKHKELLCENALCLLK